MHPPRRMHLSQARSSTVEFGNVDALFQVAKKIGFVEAINRAAPTGRVEALSVCEPPPLYLVCPFRPPVADASLLVIPLALVVLVSAFLIRKTRLRAYQGISAFADAFNLTLRRSGLQNEPQAVGTVGGRPVLARFAASTRSKRSFTNPKKMSADDFLSAADHGWFCPRDCPVDG